MDSLKFSEGNSSIAIDRNGFVLNGNRTNWHEILHCTEISVPVVDLGNRKYLSLHIGTDVQEIAEEPAYQYMALRIIMKEILPDKVTLDGPRYLKFGPEECEFTVSIAKFLNGIGQVEGSKFAFEKAIELIEYYHNPKHKLLIEPLNSLAVLLRNSDPDKATGLQNRARSIENAPRTDKSLVQSVAGAWNKKDRIKQLIAEFRAQKGREPKPAEKAQILKQMESE